MLAALDAALDLPAGTLERAVRDNAPELIRRAPYPHSEWLAAVLARRGCTADAAALRYAAQILLRGGDPAMRELALAGLAIARLLPGQEWREGFEQRLAGRPDLTAADRAVFSMAADQYAAAPSGR